MQHDSSSMQPSSKAHHEKLYDRPQHRNDSIRIPNRYADDNGELSF